MADTILVPLELPDPEPLSPVLVDDLSSLDVVVLGHYDLPEQTPVRDAREQFGDAAQATLDEVAETFADAGATVRTRLVFGKDRATTIERVAAEEECAAELDPAPTERIERILVPLPDVAEFDRLPAFVRLLSEDSTQEITLFHVVEGEERRERGETVVAETRERLVEDGFNAESVDTLVVEGDGHDEEILRVAAEYDAVVMYEPESNVTDRVFGSLADRIADETGDPVIVVNRDY
ncbi:universal stress protein [Halorubrum lipolyticum]|uniref:UspA domain protein n=1 Tax=Halorubrum lipolyticum DSM 21995 TaxID=1227482 RepID=M0NJS9_9EURY|nr:universal stress protein [Halorubrum lipolyticum]EMA58081.1 UspA domain protein [Halorubrum lipolyticum DSM 21995]